MSHRRWILALLAMATALGCKEESKPASPAAKPAAPGSATPTATTPPTPPPPAIDAAAMDVAPTWQPYTSKEGRFSIELPATPKEQDQGGLKIVGAEFGTTAADSRTAMCGVAFMKLPVVGKQDPKVILDGATARHKQSAKVIEEKDVKIGKHPGRSLIIENTSHRKWMRVYLVDGTIYILNCGGPFDRAAADGPIALKMLDSFKLTK